METKEEIREKDEYGPKEIFEYSLIEIDKDHPFIPCPKNN